MPKDRPLTANSGTMATVLPKGRSSTANSGTKVAILLGMNRCGSFSLLAALQIVGVLKITPHSYPWLEVDIGKMMCPLFSLFKIWQPYSTMHARKLLGVNMLSVALATVVVDQCSCLLFWRLINVFFIKVKPFLKHGVRSGELTAKICRI